MENYENYVLESASAWGLAFTEENDMLLYVQLFFEDPNKMVVSIKISIRCVIFHRSLGKFRHREALRQEVAWAFSWALAIYGKDLDMPTHTLLPMLSRNIPLLTKISIYLLLLLRTPCIPKSNEFEKSWMQCHKFLLGPSAPYHAQVVFLGKGMVHACCCDSAVLQLSQIQV